MEREKQRRRGKEKDASVEGTHTPPRPHLTPPGPATPPDTPARGPSFPSGLPGPDFPAGGRGSPKLLPVTRQNQDGRRAASASPPRSPR
jgi:hypothetical protein